MAKKYKKNVRFDIDVPHLGTLTKEEAKQKIVEIFAERNEVDIESAKESIYDMILFNKSPMVDQDYLFVQCTVDIKRTETSTKTERFFVGYLDFYS